MGSTGDVVSLLKGERDRGWKQASNRRVFAGGLLRGWYEVED